MPSKVGDVEAEDMEDGPSAMQHAEEDDTSEKDAEALDSGEDEEADVARLLGIDEEETDSALRGSSSVCSDQELTSLEE